MGIPVELTELEAHLASFVERAKAGERFVVCHLGAPVAELGPLRNDLPIRPATNPASDLLKLKGVPASVPVDVVELLRADRGER